MVDEAVEFGYQVEARHQQAVEYGILLALECAEEVVQVVHKYRIAGEQPAVGIEGGGFLVEVSGAYIGVAGQFVSLLVAAQHERHFGMHLQSGQAEQDVDAGGFHHLGGCQVVLFIETGFQFYEDGHFLAVLCGGYQGVDDGGVFGNAVLGHHDLADGRLVHCFVQEMDEVFERVVGVMQQQVFLLHIAEDGFTLVQTGQFHGLWLADGAYGIVRVGQVAQVFHVEVLVARNQFLAVDAEGVYQKVQKVIRHGAVVHKTADGSYLALLYLCLYLLYDLGGIGRFVYQYVRIPRDLDAIAAVHVIAGENRVDIGFDNVLDEHQIVVLVLFGKLDETGHLAVRQLHHEILRMVGVARQSAFGMQAYGKVKAVVAQEGDDLVLAHRYGREIRENLFAEEASQELFMERLHVAALVENYVMLPQCGQYLLFVDADAFFQLAVHLFVDFGYQLYGGLHALLVAMRGAGGNGLVVGHAYLVELFQVGRVYGYEVDALVQRQRVVLCLQQHPVVE